jgi:hypothetical protein
MHVKHLMFSSWLLFFYDFQYSGVSVCFELGVGAQAEGMMH